ncbi:hypothetical protein ACOMHN_042269 [Nucella lapillus]
MRAAAAAHRKDQTQQGWPPPTRPQRPNIASITTTTSNMYKSLFPDQRLHSTHLTRLSSSTSPLLSLQLPAICTRLLGVVRHRSSGPTPAVGGEGGQAQQTPLLPPPGGVRRGVGNQAGPGVPDNGCPGHSPGPFRHKASDLRCCRAQWCEDGSQVRRARHAVGGG